MISIVVPFYGGNPNVFNRCMGSIFESLINYPYDAQVYVEDDATPIDDEVSTRISSDFRISEWEKLLQFTYTRNETNVGFTGNVNRGLIKAMKDKAEYVFVVNTDVYVRPGWIESTIVLSEDLNDRAIIGFKLLDSAGKIAHAGAYGAGFHHGIGIENIAYYDEREVEWVTGAAFMIPQPVLDKLGLLDEKYPMWGSDREYCLTARRNGFSIWYNPFALVHLSENSTTDEVKAKWMDGPR